MRPSTPSHEASASLSLFLAALVVAEPDGHRPVICSPAQSSASAAVSSTPPPTVKRLHGLPPAVPSASSESASESAWESFYRRNATHFFKDRHYLAEVYPSLWADLQSKPMHVLDMGCGVGNTALPLLEQCPLATIDAVDVSAEAIALLQADSRFDLERCGASSADIASSSYEPPHSQFDLVLLMFVLSAVPAACMEAVVAKAARALKTGGRLLLRDYAAGDLAETRFRRGAAVARHSYTRGDGSLTCFFTLAGLDAMLSKVGLTRVSADILLRENVNRLQGRAMIRHFVSVIYMKCS